MGEICEKFERALHREKCITEKCSCSQCDSLSCFEKKYPYTLCGNCERAETCSNYINYNSCSGTKLSSSYQYVAYFKPRNPVIDRNLDEFTQDDMIYESDRHTVLDANRQPETTTHDYKERFLPEKVTTDLKNKSISLDEYIANITGKGSKNKQKCTVQLKETKPLDTNLQQTTVYSTSGTSESTKICSKHCTQKSMVENDRNYETDRKTLMEVNQPPSLVAYIDKLSQKSNYKIKENALDTYIHQLKHAKRLKPLENIIHYPNGNCEHQNSHQNIKQNTLENYVNQLKHANRSEPLENKANYCNENCSKSNCHKKIKENILDDTVNQLALPVGKVGNGRNYESDRERLMEINQTPSLSAYIDKISRGSNYKIKENALDIYINKLKHTKSSEPLENITRYSNVQYSQSQNSQHKIKENALDEYVKQIKHAKSSEPFKNAIHHSNKHSTTSVSRKMRSYENYSASKLPKSHKRTCFGHNKKDKCSHAEIISCPFMSLNQSVSKFSNPSLNTCISCKELSVNKNNNFNFDIFQKLVDIYKTCRCKVCECIGPKIIKNEICTCKPCDCAECSRFVRAINCPSLYYDQSQIHTPIQADSHACDHPGCPMYQNKKPRKPPCECANRQSETMQKVPCQSLQHDRKEHVRKCLSVPDNDDQQCIPTKDHGYCYTVNKKKNNDKNAIAMYTSIRPMYPNLYSYNRQSKTCDCKQCECIICQEAIAGITKPSNLRTTLDYTTNDICNCKPCECPECTSFLTKYKFEQLHQTAYKPSNSSIYSSYDNGSFYPYRCSLCRSEHYLGDDIDLKPVKKGDVLTPAAHQAKVQKQIQEKRKLLKSLGHQKESLSKVSNNYLKFLVDFHNYHKNKDNYIASRTTEVVTQLKKDISTTLTKSFHRWAMAKCDASVQSVELTSNKPELKNNSTNKTLGSYASMFSSTGTASKASLCKENDSVPPANSNKSSVSSCYSSEPNNCGYVVQFPKSAVASCIEGVMKSGLEDDLHLFKFNFDPTKQTNILGTRKFYPASDDENVIGASTSTSADVKYGQKNHSDIENDKNVININSNAAKSSDPYGFKNLKDNLQVKPIITSSETSHFNNSVFRRKSHDECFHMIQSFNNINFTHYLNKYNRYEKPTLKNNDAVPNVDDYYERVQKTLKDSKSYTSHLQELLNMYEKENNEFVKISDKLKTTYEPVYNRFKHGNVFVVNRKMPTLPEVPTHVPNFGEVGNMPFEKVKTRDTGYDKPISQEKRSNFSKFVPKQELTNNNYGMIEKIIEDKIYEHSNEICYGTLENKLSNVKSTNTLNEVITETANESFSPVLEKDDSNISNKEENRTSDNKSVESATKDMKTGLDYLMRCRVDKEENASLNPIYVAPKETMTSTSFQTFASRSPKKKFSYKENKALKKLQHKVKKLVDMAILQSLNCIDDDSSEMESSSGLSSIDKFNFDSEFSNQCSPSNEQANKEVWCDNLQITRELKKQIKNHLKTACMHPLLTSQQSSKCLENMSVSCHSCCESNKVRYLMVQKISEHTALLKWSQPRELADIKGYELLVDGRTVQKIFNPFKCIAAVTCLPHSDKILLTIRTLTSVVSQHGHYPASTIIYRPRVK